MSVAFQMFRGDTKTRGVAFKQAAHKTLPFDLTGITTLTITANSDINPDSDDPGTEYWSVAMVITSATLGTATFALTATQADMTPAVYYFDIESVDTLGGILTLFKGSFKVNQDINKP